MDSIGNIKNSDNYFTSWGIISESVEQILNSEAKVVTSFEPLYSRVYKNVCDGFSEQLHLDLITLCSKYLHGINEKLCSNDEFSVRHVLSVQSGLRGYLLSIKIISSVFSYLNKFYVAYYLNSDLFLQLANLFTQIIISERITTLMDIVEESLKMPFTIEPDVLYSFFNQLHQISNGEYSTKYLHLFSRYCPNVIPPMKESDIEKHIAEVYNFSHGENQCWHINGGRKGIKRSAEEPLQRIKNYQLPRTQPVNDQPIITSGTSKRLQESLKWAVKM